MKIIIKYVMMKTCLMLVIFVWPHVKESQRMRKLMLACLNLYLIYIYIYILDSGKVDRVQYKPHTGLHCHVIPFHSIATQSSILHPRGDFHFTHPFIHSLTHSLTHTRPHSFLTVPFILYIYIYHHHHYYHFFGSELNINLNTINGQCTINYSHLIWLAILDFSIYIIATLISFLSFC